MAWSRNLALHGAMCAALSCALACTDQQDLGKDAQNDASTSGEPVTASDAGPLPQADGSAPAQPGSDAAISEPDGSAGDGDGPDAALPPHKACNPTAPWLTSTWWRLPQNGEIDSADDAWLSPDQLRVYFSDGAQLGFGDGSLYEQRRTDTDSAFAGAKLLFVPSEDQMDTRKSTYGGRPTLTPDLLTLVFANRWGWLLKATRASADDMFPTPEWVAYDEQSRGDTDPAFTLGGRELWFVAQHAQVGLPGLPIPSEDSNQELMRVSLSSGSAAAEPVAELNSPRDDYSPAISGDGLWVYFASARERAGGDVTPGVYVAHRASTDDPFSHIEEVLDLGMALPLWLSPDYCSLYYLQNGSVYEARRQQ